MEDKTKRFKRLQSSPIEAIETLLNSIDNGINLEIEKARDSKLYNLMFLGIHAAMLTIAESVFSERDKDGYKFFIQSFTDPKAKIIEIADNLHSWRNVVAHRWLSQIGHEITFDESIKQVWEKKDGVLVLNPKLYCDQYIKAFDSNSKLWDYEQLLTEQSLSQAHQNILTQFNKN